MKEQIQDLIDILEEQRYEWDSMNEVDIDELIELTGQENHTVTIDTYTLNHLLLQIKGE